MNVVYFCDPSDKKDSSANKNINKFIKSIGVKTPKRLRDECSTVNFMDRKEAKVLRFYLDMERINRLIIPSLDVISNDANVISAFILYVYEKQTRLIIMNSAQNEFVQNELLRLENKGVIEWKRQY